MVDHLLEFLEGDGDLLLLTVDTVSDFVVLNLFVTDDKGEWNLFDDRLPHTVAKLLVVGIDFASDSFFPHDIGDLFGVFSVDLAIDWEDVDLDWGKEGWEGTAEVFGDDADESLNGAKDDAVEHDRHDLLTILVYVVAVEPLWEVDVKLNGSALPGSAHAVLEFEVELWTIESTVFWVDAIFMSARLASSGKSGFALLPEFLGADMVIWHRRKNNLIGKTEDAINLIKELHDVFDFALDLVLSDEDVAIVLGEGTDSE